jgi:hypothetical protein
MTTNASPVTSTVPPTTDAGVAARSPERRSWFAPLAVWTLLLAVGFAAVLTLGAPLASSEDALEAAYHPAPPVTEAAAVASAETIVRLEYPAMEGATRTVSRRNDLGVDRWVIVYAMEDRLSLVRISVEIASGDVRVFYLP